MPVGFSWIAWSPTVLAGLAYASSTPRSPPKKLIPLSTRVAEAIRSQRAGVVQHWPRAPWLFPAPGGNPDGARPFQWSTLRGRLERWQAAIDRHDADGRPVHISPHRFRHTVGTRLINAGVPEHVVQRLLGHASPVMTATYARLHDTTVREAFAAYCETHVDMTGRWLPFDPASPTAEAEWVRRQLARIQASLPNGCCGQPPQQHCPHPNACLT